MEHLFTEQNLSVLKSFSLVETLYAFDFDGTLAPLVANPGEVCIPDAVCEKLLVLNEKVSLAVVTGRGIEDIKSKLPFTPKFLIGNHGIETDKNGSDLNHFSKLCASWIDIIEATYSQMLPKLGIEIENKKYSLSFHYRKSKDVKMAEEFLGQLSLKFPEAKTVKGKFVVNIVPVLGMNKGEALKKLMKEENFRFCIYAGDDQTDEDVFVNRSPELMTIRIEKSPSSKAKYFLNNFTEVEKLLDYLVKFNS